MCIIGLVTIDNRGFIYIGWDHAWVLCIYSLYSRCKCGIKGFLWCQSHVAVYPAHQSCLQVGGVCVERLGHLVKIFVFRISTYCGDGFDDEIGYYIIGCLWLCDV